jgi:hypothetical protein
MLPVGQPAVQELPQVAVAGYTASQQAALAPALSNPAMGMSELEPLGTKSAPHTTGSWSGASPFVSLHFAVVGKPAAQLPVAVMTQLAVVVPSTRVQVAVVCVPDEAQLAVQVEPTVVPQSVAQYALATLVRGTPRQRTARQEAGQHICREQSCMHGAKEAIKQSI